MRIVSKILARIGIMVIVLIFIKCDKDRSEDDLTISIDAAAEERSLSANFDFNLTISSEMPEPGVTIDYDITGEMDNHVYYKKSTSTKSSNNRLTIYGVPQQIWCICTITVTSNGKKNNVATASFRLGRK